MNIEAVLISGELPANCHACDLFLMTMHEGYDICPFQKLADEDIQIDYYDKLAEKNKRPDWCPLIMEKELKKYKFVSGEYHNQGGTIPSVESEE